MRRGVVTFYRDRSMCRSRRMPHPPHCGIRGHQEHKKKFREFSPMMWRPLSTLFARSVALLADIMPLNKIFVTAVSNLTNTQRRLQMKFKLKLSRTSTGLDGNSRTYVSFIFYRDIALPAPFCLARWEYGRTGRSPWQQWWKQPNPSQQKVVR